MIKIGRSAEKLTFDFNIFILAIIFPLLKVQFGE